MHLLNAVERYINAGQAPIPVWPDRRKNPHLSSIKEYHSRLPTMAEWRRWAHQWPHCNIGLITGYHGLIALDFDTVEDYDAWQGLKGQTWTVATHRGYHVWFRVTTFDPGQSRMFVSDEMDSEHEVLLRAKGGYCIVPPSRHWRGSRYRTVHKAPPLQVDSLDDILLEWRPRTAKQTTKIVQQQHPGPDLRLLITDLVPVPEGSRPNSRGAHLVRCPIHQDSTPSAWVNPDQNRFGCNVCTPDGYFDTVGLYAELNNISNREAYIALMGRRDQAEPANT